MTLKHNIWYVNNNKEGQDLKIFSNEADALDWIALAYEGLSGEDLPAEEGWVVIKNMNKFLGEEMEWADE
tara:strand:- start:1376 stop:1585 length:210 start_codon:yes stop_codon:yes gene_type:complete